MKHQTVGQALIVIAFAFVCGFWFYGFWFSEKIESARMIVELQSQRKINAGLLVNWVYAHSNRISKQTAQSIVDSAVATDKGLLILAIFEVESNFVPTAVSHKDAIGLGQIRYSVHKKVLNDTGIAIDSRDLFDVDRNVQATHLLITDMLKQANGDIEKALRAYLGGRDGVYVARICRNYVELSLAQNVQTTKENVKPEEEKHGSMR